MVRFVFKRGPFCLKTWSVLSWPWSVLSWRGPFCPWSVLSMVRFVPNSSVVGLKTSLEYKRKGSAPKLSVVVSYRNVYMVGVWLSISVNMY